MRFENSALKKGSMNGPILKDGVVYVNKRGFTPEKA
jgi:hypothetical protein